VISKYFDIVMVVAELTPDKEVALAAVAAFASALVKLPFLTAFTSAKDEAL